MSRPAIVALIVLGALLAHPGKGARAAVGRSHHRSHRSHHSHRSHGSHHSHRVPGGRRLPWTAPQPVPYPPQRAQDAVASGRCVSATGMRIIGFTVDDHRFTPRWIARTLHGVIANHCHSKTYHDMIPLDGGTVGISHFAVGSLRTLYREMNARRYFGEHATSIPDRPYRFSWWRDGMRSFLYSAEAQDTQIRAWQAYITPTLRAALRHGWSTDRDLAIAAGVGNSLGAGGFAGMAGQAKWNPERTLLLYSRLTSHKERRRLRLDAEFPPDDNGLVAFPGGVDREAPKAPRFIDPPALTPPYPPNHQSPKGAPRMQLTPTGPTLSNLKL